MDWFLHDNGLPHEKVKTISFFMTLTIHYPVLHFLQNWKEEQDGRTDNYRPVSILQTLSKVYERCMYGQVSAFLDIFLSISQCGFWKGCSTQTCLKSREVGKCFIVKWRKSNDKGRVSRAIMTDLLKAFDCIYHNLPIAKLAAFLV